MSRRFRPRKEFKFWLYHDLPEQVRLMEYIKYLNQTRQFATVVRNGLRLMWSLGEGDFSVLFELFPGAKAQFNPPAPQTPPDGFQQMLEDAAKKGAQLALMEAPALPAPPAGYPVLKPSTASAGGSLPMGGTGNLKLSSGKSLDIAMPTFDDLDDQDTVVVKTKDNAVGDGWLDRMFALQSSLGNAEITDARINIRETTIRPPREDSEAGLVVKRPIEAEKDNPPAPRSQSKKGATPAASTSSIPNVVFKGKGITKDGRSNRFS